ncbi:MAG: flagellar M-ring protein FliF C-terminal domain-containing protein [Planctomycetota bacterium]
MGPLKSYLDGALEIWTGATPAARIGLSMMALLSVAAIIGVGYWSSQPTYVDLPGEADHIKMGEVIDQLDKAGIQYQLSGAGGILRVDERDFARAVLIAKNAGIAVDDVATSDSGPFPRSPREFEEQKRIQIQQRIANLIKEVDVIVDADVLLSLPENGPFERENTPPSAGVVLTLAAGTRLPESIALNIADLVASSVGEGLTPEKVVITDTTGRRYSVPDSDVQHINSQVEYTLERESRLARKAEAQLTQLLGIGNVTVQVALDYTFPNGSKRVISYDAEGKVASTENIRTYESTQPRENASGAAGIDANLQNNPGGGSDGIHKEETIDSEFQVPMTEETISNTTPILNFMTVSVLVNSAAAGVTDETGGLSAGIEEEIRATVENAVGFNSENGGGVSVVFRPFSHSTDEPVETAAPFDWDWLNELLRNSSLAIAALVSFVLGFLVLRKIKPVPTEPAPAPGVKTDRLKTIEQLGGLVKDNPEVFTRIIQYWAEENSTPPAEKNSPERRAA